MNYRRNLRDILVLLVLASFLGVFFQPTTEERQGCLSIHSLTLGDTAARVTSLGLQEQSMAYTTSRIFRDENRILARIGSPASGVTELEGVQFERDGLLIAQAGSSRETVVHHLGPPTTSRENSDALEDYYASEQLLIRYRADRLERVWMQSGAERWFRQGNWPEPLSDYG